MTRVASSVDARGRKNLMGEVTECLGGLVRRVRSAPRGLVWAMLLLGVVTVFGAGVAGAAPLGAITEFSGGLNPGSNDGQVRAGPDGNLWFSDRGTIPAIGMITTSGAITEFSSGLNAGSAPYSIVAGADGNLWFTDQGTIPAIGMINPATHVITEFSSGLNAGSKPAGIAAGPDGNVWFTDEGTIPAIGMINPATHVITEF